MSQNLQILSHLQGGRSLTSYEALVQFGSLRLSARIHNLKSKGFNIQGKMIETSSGKRVMRYFIPRSI